MSGAAARTVAFSETSSGVAGGSIDKGNMGRLLWTENGVQVWRNFKYYCVIFPDGRISDVREFAGTIGLVTGTDEERSLRFVYPAHGVTKRTLRNRIYDGLFGAVVVLIVAVLLNAL